MGKTRAITVSVAILVIILAIAYAMHLDDERGKGEFFFGLGPRHHNGVSYERRVHREHRVIRRLVITFITIITNYSYYTATAYHHP